MLPLPDHAPTEPVSVLPSSSTTATAGIAVTDGPAPPVGFALTGAAAAAFTSVAVLKTARAAAPFRACARATRTWPRSSAPIACVWFVSPEIAVHARSSALQRAHWYTNDDGFGCQRPVSTRIVLPLTARPAITGCVSASSCGCAPATGPTRLAKARVEPFASLARTETLIVWPTSFAPRRWTFVCTPWTVRQWRPIGSQRNQSYEYLSVPAPDQDPRDATRRVPWVASPWTTGRFVDWGPAAAPAGPAARRAQARAADSSSGR